MDQPARAEPHHGSRLHRAKALAARAVAASGMHTTTLASSLVYAPGDRRLLRLERLALLPVVPLLGGGRARTQPIWADDVAACVMRVLETGDAAAARYELAGPVLVYLVPLRIAIHALDCDVPATIPVGCRRRMSATDLMLKPVPVSAALVRGGEIAAREDRVRRRSGASRISTTGSTPS